MRNVIAGSKNLLIGSVDKPQSKHFNGFSSVFFWSCRCTSLLCWMLKVGASGSCGLCVQQGRQPCSAQAIQPTWAVPAPSAAAHPAQGHFQSWCWSSLGHGHLMALNSLGAVGSLGYVVHLWNFAAVIKVRDDELLQDLWEECPSLCCSSSLRGQDLSGLQKGL